MKSKKLLRLTIMDALDLALINNGISHPSKKIRKTIIKASEKISRTVHEELKKQHTVNRVQDIEMFRLSRFLQPVESETTV